MIDHSRVLYWVRAGDERSQRRSLDGVREAGEGTGADWYCNELLVQAVEDEPDVPVQRTTSTPAVGGPTMSQSVYQDVQETCRECLTEKENEEDERLRSTLAAFGFTATQHSQI